MKFDIVSGEDLYRNAHKAWVESANATLAKVLEHATGRVYTTRYLHKAYIEQRENLLKKRPSKSGYVAIRPLPMAFRVTGGFIDSDATYIDGVYRDYSDTEIVLQELHPELRCVALEGTNVGSAGTERVQRIQWKLGEENGGLVEIDPDDFDLTDEDVENSRVRLKAERKVLHGLKR